MKHFLKPILLSLALPGLACFGAPSLFNNYGVLDTPTNITAVHFNNYGFIDFDSRTLYNTYDTAYYTNTGTMEGSQGFRFANVSPKTIVPSISFNNSGIVEGLDSGGIIFIGNGGSGSIPSDVTVNAKNVANTGTLAVGANGTMTINGQNVDLSYGILEAGSASGGSDAGTELAESYDWFTSGQSSTAQLFTSDAPGTYDILWGATNNLMGRIPNLVTPDPKPGLYDVNLPGMFSTNRGSFGGVRVPVVAEGLTAFAFTYPNPNIPLGTNVVTNLYYDVVLIDTNFVSGDGFTDTNTHVTVQFGDPTALAGFNYVPPQPGVAFTDNPNGIPILVQIYEAAVDPITGVAATNSIYLEDDGDTVTPITIAQNAAYTAAYSRPDCFEVTFTQPPELPSEFLLQSNTNFDLGEIYTAGVMGLVEPMTNAVYEVQVGSDPQSLSGAFPSLTGIETLADIPDITNQPGRITINANNLNLHDLKLAASGFLEINGTNTTGAPTVFNYGTANINLSARTNSLIVTNFVPTLFQQLRGNIELYSATWDNTQTNITATSTNDIDIHTHLFYIGDNLSARYTPTVRNFHLKSTNMVVQNNVEVIQDAKFNGPNLTVISNIYLTQGAANFFPVAAPGLRNLFITNGGSFVADSLLDIGMPPPIVVKSPIGRGYSVLTITNQGFVEATSPTFQARTIENDGDIVTVNRGSVILAANTLKLGFKLPTNTFEDQIIAGGAVTLSANTIEVTNTVISASQLILTPVAEFTDFTAKDLGTNIIFNVSSDPGTNGDVGVSDLVNFWSVTGGLQLTRKPTHGDLYGTEIQVTANALVAPTLVTWAAQDRGDQPRGFVDNAVIGTLVLDRTTNSAIIQLQGSGNKSAMYVNYLMLMDSSLTDSNHNTFVAPNLTIYVAAANIPVSQLTNISPRIVYAANSVSAQAAIAEANARGVSAPSLTSIGSPSVPTATPLPGVYSGLFGPSSGASLDDSGLLTFTLEKGGAFSGHVLIGSRSIPFSSKLSGNGFGSVEVDSLAISFTIGAGGNLAGAIIGDGWSSDLTGALAATGSSKLAGHYSITLPGPGGDGPIASSVGRVTISPQGVVTASGRLADGALFTQSSRLNINGQWPFYSYAPGRKDVVTGWLTFSGNPTQISGPVKWVKAPQTGGSSGFESVIQATGAAAK